MSDPRRVAVVGVTGYAGFELAKLLLRHPKIEKPVFYLREGSTQARCLTEIFPQLRGWAKRRAGRFPWTRLSRAAPGRSSYPRRMRYR